MWPRVKDRVRAVLDRFPGVTAVLGSLWSRVRDEPLIGIAFSLILHVVLIALVLYAGRPGSTYTTKRGEPLFVELPETKDQAPRGNPAAREPGPPAAPAPEPPRPSVAKVEPPPAPKASPPVAKPSPPAPRTPPAPKAPEAKPQVTEPKQVAAARPPEPARERPAPSAEKPAPKPPEPPPAAKETLPAPTPAPPTPPAPTHEARPASPPEARPTPAPTPETRPAAPPAPPQEARVTPAPPAAEPPRPSGAGTQVAAVPPSKREPVFDLKSLGRGGGAGGRGEGRGGIEGEPIPLDSRDPKYSDYLDRIRRMIKERWGYPCVKNGGTGQCEYKTAQLVIEFGIAKDGNVPFVHVLRTSGWAIYDDYALNAIKLASPFPPLPDALSKKGIPIMATFHYVVDTSLVNTLR
jgi:TonB family protein